MLLREVVVGVSDILLNFVSFREEDSKTQSSLNCLSPYSPHLILSASAPMPTSSD